MRERIDRVSPTSSTSARWREVWQLALAEHMTAAESLEMRVIASLLNMGRSRGRFAAVAPTAATMTSLATTPKARISISPSMRPMVGSAFACTSTWGCTKCKGCKELHALIRPRAKSINEAPVGYTAGNGAAFVQHRAALRV